MITLTDASSLQPDDPVDIDENQIAILQVNRVRPNGGTTITLQCGTVIVVQEDIATVRKMLAEAKHASNH